MNKIVSVVFALFLLLICYKATANSSVNLLTKFTPLDIAKGEFQQKKFFKVLTHPIESSGDIYFDINQGLLWQTNVPVHSAMILKPSGLYISDGLSELRKVNGANSIIQVLISAMSGNLKALEAEFTLQQIADGQCLSLQPIDELMAKVIEKINLCGDKSLEKIHLFESSGNRTEITLQLQQIDKLPEVVIEQLK